MNLLDPTGRYTISLIHRGNETHTTTLWRADGLATKRARALIRWMVGSR